MQLSLKELNELIYCVGTVMSSKTNTYGAEDRTALYEKLTTELESRVNDLVELERAPKKRPTRKELFGVNRLQVYKSTQKTQFNELVIVKSNEEKLSDYLSNFDFSDLNVKIVEYSGEPNYSSQINLGIENSSSEWISFFEFDDEYSSIWFNNVEKYITYHPDVEAFLPVVIDVDSKSVFAGFTNEATFAANFSQEVGILTNEIFEGLPTVATAQTITVSGNPNAGFTASIATAKNWVVVA